METSKNTITQEITAAAAAQDKAEETVEVYAFITQAAGTIDTFREASQLKQSAKGVIAGHLRSIGRERIPYAQLETSFASLVTRMQTLANKKRTPAEELDLSGVTLAVRAWEMVVAAGIRNDELAPVAARRIVAPAAEPARPTSTRLPLKSGHIRTLSLTNALLRLSEQAGIDKPHTQLLIDTFSSSLNVSEMAELSLAHFNAILTKLERLARGDASKRMLYDATHDMLQQALYDLRDTENTGRSIDGVVDGAYRESARQFAQMELAAPVPPLPPKVTKAEEKGAPDTGTVLLPVRSFVPKPAVQPVSRRATAAPQARRTDEGLMFYTNAVRSFGGSPGNPNYQHIWQELTALADERVPDTNGCVQVKYWDRNFHLGKRQYGTQMHWAVDASDVLLLKDVHDVQKEMRKRSRKADMPTAEPEKPNAPPPQATPGTDGNGTFDKAVETPPAHPAGNWAARVQQAATGRPATRADSTLRVPTQPTTFKKACGLMNQWLEEHGYEIATLHDPQSLAHVTPEQLHSQLAPVRNAIAHSNGKVLGNKLLDHLVTTHETLFNRGKAPAPGTVWGNGGVVSR